MPFIGGLRRAGWMKLGATPTAAADDNLTAQAKEKAALGGSPEAALE